MALPWTVMASDVDIAVFLAPDQTMRHVAVYLADDLYFTKNGDNPWHPWVYSTLDDLLMELRLRARARILVARQPVLHRQEVRRVEARVDRGQPLEAAHRESRGDEQDGRHRNLRHHEYRPGARDAGIGGQPGAGVPRQPAMARPLEGCRPPRRAPGAPMGERPDLDRRHAAAPFGAGKVVRCEGLLHRSGQCPQSGPA